jgi:predicted enzyme related to lactoylglutathione lyase
LRLRKTTEGPEKVFCRPDGSGKGWRYITFQVFEVDREHAHVLANGGREGRSPQTLGTVARISMIRDPDGNWIELSQRASITGLLERNGGSGKKPQD